MNKYVLVLSISAVIFAVFFVIFPPPKTSGFCLAFVNLCNALSAFIWLSLLNAKEDK